uniref:hypothetical protein n=1 Tax=Neolewinella agarilytica TaxID=478744 RepID=UPI0023557ED8
LREPSKGKFRILLPVITSANEGFKGIINRFQVIGCDRWGAPLPVDEQANALRQLSNDIALDLSMFQSAYFNMLNEHGKEVDLRDEDVEEAKERARNFLQEGFGKSLDNLMSGNHFQRRDLLILAYVQVHERILQDVVDIAGGKVIACHFGPKQYPFIAESFENPRVGEPINTYLGIGTYDDELDIHHLRVVVNGDTLRANNRFGMMQYSFTPRHKGDQALEMEMLYENPLTGEVFSRKYYHNYFVR